MKSGRICEGYKERNIVPRYTIPRVLAPAPIAIHNIEARALEFFFIKTAPQLAGYFEAGFFQGSVLRLSLTEPIIRQVISAIGLAHGNAAVGNGTLDSDALQPYRHIELYNRSIRAAIEKVSAEPDASPDTMCLIATANILFTCFEVMQGNIPAAAAHVQSGQRLFQQWRDINGGPTGPWGRDKYRSPEAKFMETEIAPLLALFNTNSVECGGGGRTKLLLNSVDEQSGLFVTDGFETLGEARIGLIDMVTCAVHLSHQVDYENGETASTQNIVSALSQRVKRLLNLWNKNFESLLSRQNVSRSKRKQKMIDVIRIIKYSTEFGIRSFTAKSECEWDLHREEYAEGIRVIDAIVSDQDRFPDIISRTMNLDAGMIFPLHTLAWKCRWPKLRRQGLALLQRIPRREWLYESLHYHAIFSRIMAIEESGLRLVLGMEPEESWLPPEHVRIIDWTVTATKPFTPGVHPEYEITFFSKPQGVDGPVNRYTETMQFEFTQNFESAVPVNMISSKLITRAS